MESCGKIDELVALILNRGDLEIIGAGCIPPLVGLDAVAVSVGAGADGGVAGSGLGVGVVVVAVGEPGALLHEEIEAAAFELVAVAIEVVAAELVDDHNDDELGAAFKDLGLGNKLQGKQIERAANRAKQWRDRDRTLEFIV